MHIKTVDIYLPKTTRYTISAAGPRPYWCNIAGFWCKGAGMISYQHLPAAFVRGESSREAGVRLVPVHTLRIRPGAPMISIQSGLILKRRSPEQFCWILFVACLQVLWAGGGGPA